MLSFPISFGCICWPGKDFYRVDSRRNVGHSFTGLSTPYIADLELIILSSCSDNPIPVHEDAEFAVSVENGSFSWEMTKKDGNSTAAGSSGRDRRSKKKKKEEAKKKAAEDKEKVGSGEDTKPFSLSDINLKIPRGSFVVICGRVGVSYRLFRDDINPSRRTQARGLTSFTLDAYFTMVVW